MAQSIGGGGGYLTLSSSPHFIFNGSTGEGLSISGNVDVENSESIETLGTGSQALIAQSIAGGGGFIGDAGTTDSNVSKVMLGSSGSNDGDILARVQKRENIWNDFLATNPDWKSIDFISSAWTALAGTNNNLPNVGGITQAGNVNVISKGESLTTRSNNSSVILAQSIGGGGGWALLENGGEYSVLGSSATLNGIAGSVTVDNSSNLLSLGKNSPALIAQSIGGGGGATGDAKLYARLGKLSGRGTSTGNRIDVSHEGDIATAENYSSAILLQSIGGGGGLAGDVEGSAGLGSRLNRIASDHSSDDIVLDVKGNITTVGNNSPAITASSIGGGGGWIGDVGGELAMGSYASNTIQHSGSITITSEANINTLGENSTGLLVQSIAGGGGFAGINTSLYDTTLGSIDSDNGVAKDIDVTNKGEVRTSGDNSAGVLIQSIGGGGGATALGSSGTNTQKLQLGAQSFGEANSGEIDFRNTENITTAGDGSPAILIQSIAGGGGAVQSIDNAKTGSTQFGSEAVLSSNASDIDYFSEAELISTTGDESAGVIIQSIGGGGGFTLVDSLSDSNFGSINSPKSKAGSVTIDQTGDVQTQGEFSPAQIIQSIGGGGGYAGTINGDAQLGTKIDPDKPGLTNLFAGNIDINVEGNLSTLGVSSPVLLVQSIGGGGGHVAQVNGDALLGQRDAAGDASAGSINIDTRNNASFNSLEEDSAAVVVQSIGGGGGQVSAIKGILLLGADGFGNMSSGDITLDGSFTATTQGDQSPGVVLQAIGGGGGLASAVSGNSVELGTNATGDTSAGEVVARSEGWQVQTSGAYSPGFTLQSIGGGGGVAYTSTGSVSLGGAVDGETTASPVIFESEESTTIVTQGISSPAVIAQSIGGGGGYVGGDGSGVGASVVLGGSGQQLGSSGFVDVTLGRESLLSTANIQSQGVIIQSIGGGGGFTSQNGKAMSLGMSTGVGNAGNVNLINKGTIQTTGDHSEGVIAQSIGAGGGTAGRSTNSLVMGATDGAVGSAGDVVVTNEDGTVITTGDYSIGVVAQSVGAGGGRVGAASGTITLGANGARGDGGNVTLNNKNGTITTSGDFAPAYLIQSVGGGGGQVGLGDSEASGQVILGGGSNGTAGNGGQLILVNEGGLIQATGEFSPGVVHQSIGGGGGWIGNVPDGNAQIGGLSIGDSKGADLDLVMPFAVQTTSDNSPGSVLQSIGGGGGIVANVGGDVSLGGTQSINITASGGTLTYFQNDLSISTQGDDSPGTVLQSIGGGGGLVGAVEGSVNIGSASALGTDVSGSDISAESDAPISTSGVSSPGFTIQSIGGGGGLVGSAPTSVTVGSSGFGDSSSGAINFTNTGGITTNGLNSSGVILQSIGGGGVYTTSSGGAVIRLGGSVIGNNDSASITFNNEAPITTSGSNSSAVVVQSIGGGGGAVFGLEDASVTTLTLGANNAAENQANNLDISIDGDLTTGADADEPGNNSPALIAQSIGGGGGYAPLASTNASLGSRASENLDAGSITLNIDANVRTSGFASDGLLIQSIGAGGGIAGSTTSSLSMGATDLANGDAANITINNTGTITTTGDQSIGISAQSIGAGGGRAGSAGGAITLGGNGASGNAGDITLNLAAEGGNGSIITTGDQAPAFVLQSIGGGGGLVFPSTETSNGNLLLGGGILGTEGSGASITFTAGGDNAITTTGSGSSGISYQTIGGGGGYTGSTTANAELGGYFRGTSSGADLTISSQIDSTTTGINAAAFMVQTLGGGGGRVGDVGGNASLGGTSGLLDTPTAKGGDLNITLDSDLTSVGDRGAGAIVQTIGGGGGVAGAIGGDATFGGLGTGDRSGGALTVTVEDNVGSGGDNAVALLTQTIGGGGGKVDTVGGSLTLGRTSTTPNSGNTSAGDLNLTISADAQIFSTGETSPAVVAQTIGGGGGFSTSASGAVQLGAGGAGTALANASSGSITWSNSAGGTSEENTPNGIVPVNTPGISTNGDLSPAVVIQSIGGGGGFTTGGRSVTFSGKDHAGSTTRSGDINATNTGVITTTGDNSFGVLLQTIGGGGGVGGSSSGVVNLNNTNETSSSGDINFTNSGTISTTGTGSHAVVAQTIAGGGGFVFGGVRKDNSDQLLGRPTGRSGDIKITNTGTISASGDNAVALLFQNATGGAYLYQNPDGSVSSITEGAVDPDAPAGEVVVINSGTIVASGEGGVAITKSTSGLLHGNLRVENEDGATVQGGDGGSAIHLPTVDQETIINRGTIIGGSDGKSDAITGPGGDDVIRNYGTISGDIILPGLTRSIYNAPDARLESNLVQANGNVTLFQRGIVNPGGEYRIGDLKVYANYDSTDTSLYEADLILRSGETDNLTTQYRASLDGTVEILANEVGQAKPGSFVSEGIIVAKKGITIGDLKLIAPKSAIANFDFELTDNGTDLAFHYDVDYAPEGLSPNSKEVGKAINKIQARGSTSKFEHVAAMIFGQKSAKKLDRLYRQLSGQTSTAFPQAVMNAGLSFQNDISLSLNDENLNQRERCWKNQHGDVDLDNTSLDKDCGKWRGWFRTSGSNSDIKGNGDSNQSGWSTNAFHSTVGADVVVNENTLIGLAGRFDKLWTTTTQPTTSGETEAWAGLLYAKHRIAKQTWLTGSFGFGDSTTDITRQVNVENPSTESGTSNSQTYSGKLQLSHDIKTNERGLLTPSLSLSWLRLNQDSYSENTTSNGRAYVQPGNSLDAVEDPGKATYSLKYKDANYTSIPLELGLSFKQPFNLGTTTIIPRITTAYAWDLGNTNRELTAEFKSAPGSPFTIDGTNAPNSWLNYGLGLDIVFNDKFTIYANTDGKWAPGNTNTINYGGGFRFKF